MKGCEILKENWYALYVAIVKGVSVEKALGFMQPRSNSKNQNKSVKIPNRRYEQFSESEVAKMVELKREMSYKEVAKQFETVDRNVYNHIKKYYPELIKSGALGYHKNHSSKNFAN